MDALIGSIHGLLEDGTHSGSMGGPFMEGRTDVRSIDGSDESIVGWLVLMPG